MQTVASCERVERAVLAACLLDGSRILEVAQVLEPPEFESEAHRLLFEAICSMAFEGRPVDMMTLWAELGRRGQQERVGGLAYVSGLDLDLPTLDHLGEYVAEVRRHASSRQLVSLMAQASKRLGETADPDSSRAYLAEMQRLVDAQTAAVTAAAFADRLDAAAARYHARASGERVDGVRTGIAGIDLELVAMAPGELIVIGGYAKSGKTTFVEQIALNAARDQHSVLMCSLEMSLEQIDDRFWQRALGCAMRTLRGGAVTADRIDAALRKLKAEDWTKLFIPMRPSSNDLRVIEREVRSICRERPISLLIVDHLHRVQVREEKGGRRLELARAALRLKEFARDLGLPLVLPAQVSRSAVNAGDRPRAWHLKESGDIEAELDTLMMLNRPNPDSLLEVHIEMVRQGEAGACVTLEYDQHSRELREGYGHTNASTYAAAGPGGMRRQKAQGGGGSGYPF